MVAAAAAAEEQEGAEEDNYSVRVRLFGIALALDGGLDV